MALGAGVDTGQGFLTDYSALSGAGAAFQGFAGAYKDAQDQQMKRQELQAKIMAQQEQMKRDATTQAIALRANHLQLGAGGPSDLQEAPLTDQQQQDKAMGEFKEGAGKPIKQPDGTYNVPMNPNTPTVLKAKTPMIKYDQNETDKTNKDWEGFSTTVNNPSSRTQLGRFQLNLDKGATLNALANQLGMPDGQMPPPNESPQARMTRFNSASPQQLYEFAKGADQLTSNANGTVYGTDHLMPKQMDSSLANLKQWMPSWAGGNKPEGANAGEFIGRYLDSANRESNYFRAARDRAVGGIAGGYKHLQAKDPARWEQILGGLNQQGYQAPPAQPQGQTGGMVNPGLVSKSPLEQAMGGKQQAAPKAKPKTVIQNGYTYTLNPATGGYE